MALLDVLGHRWVLRIVWELRADRLGFRALQARCDGMSPSVLSQRLRELESAGIVEQAENSDYRLSSDGNELFRALMPLHDWANRWADRTK
jgi:DNA-binding HxlR family transcriptional regulator